MIGLAADGMTMICVTHEMGFARLVADEIVFMDAGSVVERAPPADFFQRPQHLRTQAFLSQILQYGVGSLPWLRASLIVLELILCLRLDRSSRGTEYLAFYFDGPAEHAGWARWSLRHGSHLRGSVLIAPTARQPRSSISVREGFLL